MSKLKCNEAIHEGIILCCSECDYGTGFKTALRRHMKINHKLLDQILRGDMKTILQCDDCEEFYESSRELKQHKEVKHEGLPYSCETCDYKTQCHDTFNSHLQVEHGHMSPKVKQTSFNFNFVKTQFTFA